ANVRGGRGRGACGRGAPGGRWRGARLSVIRSDQARVDVADFAVFGLDARENKSVEQDGEALAARNGSDRIRGLPRLAEDLRVLGMSRAVDVPQFVRPSGGRQEKRACEQDEKTCARHSPPPRPGDTPSLENHFEVENEGLKPFEGTGIPKKTPVRKTGWLAGGKKRTARRGWARGEAGAGVAVKLGEEVGGLGGEHGGGRVRTADRAARKMQCEDRKKKKSSR